MTTHRTRSQSDGEVTFGPQGVWQRSRPSGSDSFEWRGVFAGQDVSFATGFATYVDNGFLSGPNAGNVGFGWIFGHPNLFRSNGVTADNYADLFRRYRAKAINSGGDLRYIGRKDRTKLTVELNPSGSELRAITLSNELGGGVRDERGVRITAWKRIIGRSVPISGAFFERLLTKDRTFRNSERSFEITSFSPATWPPFKIRRGARFRESDGNLGLRIVAFDGRNMVPTGESDIPSKSAAPRSGSFAIVIAGVGAFVVLAAATYVVTIRRSPR